MIDLRPVEPGGAPVPTQQTYAEVRAALALPWVPAIYQAFAMYPEFLGLAWRAALPRVRSAVFLDEAEALAQAAMEGSSWHRAIAARPWQGDREHARVVAQMLAEGEAKLALLAVAYRLAVDGALGQLVRLGTVSPLRPAEVRAVEMALPLASEVPTSPSLRATFVEIARALGLPAVLPEHRALAAMPGLLEAVWDDLRVVMGRAEYRAAEVKLRARIEAAARRVCLGRALDRPCLAREARLGPAALANLAALVRLFDRIAPGLCLQLAMVVRSLD